MLVCSFVIYFSGVFVCFLSLFVPLYVRSLLLLLLREQLQVGWNIVSCLFVFAFVCSRRSIVRSLICCTSFKYLGSVITDKGSKPEILSRIEQTTAALTRLNQFGMTGVFLSVPKYD